MENISPQTIESVVMPRPVSSLEKGKIPRWHARR